MYGPVKEEWGSTDTKHRIVPQLVDMLPLAYPLSISVVITIVTHTCQVGLSSRVLQATAPTSGLLHSGSLWSPQAANWLHWADDCSRAGAGCTLGIFGPWIRTEHLLRCSLGQRLKAMKIPWVRTSKRLLTTVPVRGSLWNIDSRSAEWIHHARTWGERSSFQPRLHKSIATRSARYKSSYDV